MKRLGVDVGQVTHGEDVDGLDDAHRVREARREAGEEAPDDADGRPADGHYRERHEADQHVLVFDVLRPQRHVRIEHVVQNLRRKKN